MMRRGRLIPGCLLAGLVLFFPITPAKAYVCYFDGPEGQIFTTGKDVQFSVEAKEEVGAVRIVNFDGATVQTIPVAERGKRLPVNLGNLPSGIYWITEVDGRVLYAFAVIPPAGRTVKSEDSPFGVHYAYVDNEVDRAARRLDLLKQVGVAWVRCSTYVTPNKENPDTFDWTARDRIIAMVNERDMNMLSFFEPLNFPDEFFVADAKSGKSEIGLWNHPRTLRAIQDYVSHNKGKLKYFEVWNEPQNLKEWIVFSRACFQTVKAANPEALVVQSGLAGNAYSGQWGFKHLPQDMQKQALAAGLARFTDVFNFHYYPYQWKTNVIVPQIMDIYKNYKQTKPVWVTENGMSAAAKDIYQQKQQAEYLVRSATACFHLGVDKYFWFLGWDHPVFNYGLLEVGLEPKASYVAYAVLTQMLDNVELGSSAKLNLDRITAYTFHVPQGKVAVLWAEEGATIPLNPRVIFPKSSGVKMFDVMGRPIPWNHQGKITLFPQSPVYVTAEEKETK